MAELQHKYNLRPKETSATSSPPKNIILRNKEDEAVVTKKTVDKQAAQNKQTIEKQVSQTKQIVEKKYDPSKKVETKETQTKKIENIETQTSTRQYKKIVGGFILQNEINKIKIPMSLVELANNPIYKKKITKMIDFSHAECYEDENLTIMFGPHIENAKDLVAPFYIRLTVHDH
jgi:hypothetical protein